MANYDKALALENSALNSNGKAMEKYSIYQDSIAAKQERIVALAQTWVQNMNIEWVIGKLLSLGETLMKVFSNEAIVNITKATAAIIAFSAGFKAVSNIAKSFAIYKKYGLLSLLFSANALGAIAGIVAGITLIVAVIDKLHKSTAELREELQGINGDISSTEATLDSYNQQIQANIDKITELQALLDKGVGGIVEQEEIDNLKKSNKELETKVQLEEKRLELQKQQRAQNLKEQYDRGFTLEQYGAARSFSGEVMSMGTKRYSPEEIIDAYQEQIDKQQRLYENAVAQGWTDMADAYQKKAIDLESELVNEVIPVLQEMSETGMFPELDAILDKYLNSILTYEEKFAEVLDDSQYGEGVAQFGKLVQENLGAIEVYLSGDDNALNAFSGMITEDVNPAIAAMIAALQALGIPFTEIIRYFYNAANAGDAFSNSIQLESAASQITKFKDKVSAVVTAEEELSSTGYVSADAAEKLAEVFGEDVYDAMEWSEKGYKISKSALEELIEKQKEEYYLALSKAQAAAVAVVNANVSETASYKEKTVAILEALNAKKKELRLAMTEEVAGASSYIEGRIASRKYADQLAELEGVEDDLLTAQKNLDTLESTFKYLREAGKTSKTTGKTDTETAYERENRILEHTLYLSQQLSVQYKDSDEVAYRKEINKQLEIYNKLMELAHQEAERYRALGYSDESEEIQELQKAWWGYYNERKDLQDGLSDWEKQNTEDAKQAVEDALSEVKDAINDLLDEAEDALNKKLDALEAQIKKNEAIRDLHEAFFDILNEVADGMHEIDKELEASLSSADYLDDKLRQAMFNEDDYNKMSSKLNQIADESRVLFKDYLSQLEMLTEDEIYKADYITDEFNRQYEYKKLEYEIAEKELALAKAQTKLQNTLMNRNVRMYKNGQWIWTADYSAVEEAKKELRDAEYERRDAEIKLKQQEVIDKYEEIIDSLKLQKDAAQAEFDALKASWEEVQKQLTTEEDAMSRLLKAINETDIPEFQKIINNVGDEFKNLVSKLAEIKMDIIKTPDEEDSGVKRRVDASGIIHTSGYGIADSFGTASGGSASSDDGKDYAIYDKDGNYIARYDKTTGDITWNGDPNITGRKETVAEAIDIINKDNQKTSGSGGSGSGNSDSGGGGGSDGTYTGVSESGGTYVIGSETGKDFIENGQPGDTLHGSDGSDWTVNEDGSVTITKDGEEWTVYDSGGVLEGVGGIKATERDEMVLEPNLSSKMLSPKKSKEFLASANALNNILDNSGAIATLLTRFADIVGTKTTSNVDSHNIYINDSLMGRMTPSDSDAMASIMRRYVPITRGWK